MILELMEIILYAQDMDAQVRFYRDLLGLEVTYPRGLVDYSAESWVTFGTGACTLALHGGGQRDLGRDAPKIVFRVAQIEEARRALLAQGVSLGDLFEAAPGTRVVNGVDPEGNPFSLESNR
ncbi:MAG: hypothetical protein KC418_22985 [Anaerolineales bacterium]|nr:hypothetical protein [Anaerolineales bacterium]MCB8953101.1 hypothetical protein [Ardenticatenales bacterium]